MDESAGTVPESAGTVPGCFPPYADEPPPIDGIQLASIAFVRKLGAIRQKFHPVAAVQLAPVTPVSKTRLMLKKIRPVMAAQMRPVAAHFRLTNFH